MIHSSALTKNMSLTFQLLNLLECRLTMSIVSELLEHNWKAHNAQELSSSKKDSKKVVYSSHVLFMSSEANMIYILYVRNRPKFSFLSPVALKCHFCLHVFKHKQFSCVSLLQQFWKCANECQIFVLLYRGRFSANNNFCLQSYSFKS